MEEVTVVWIPEIGAALPESVGPRVEKDVNLLLYMDNTNAVVQE